MKIVRTDNFGRSGEAPGYDEVFVAADVPEWCASAIVLGLHTVIDPNGADPNYFKKVPDDYILKVFKL